MISYMEFVECFIMGYISGSVPFTRRNMINSATEVPKNHQVAVQVGRQKQIRQDPEARMTSLGLQGLHDQQITQHLIYPDSVVADSFAGSQKQASELQHV